jgi:hypothetical protein
LFLSLVPLIDFECTEKHAEVEANEGPRKAAKREAESDCPIPTRIGKQEYYRCHYRRTHADARKRTKAK